MDNLSKLLNHISVTADVFFSGNLCGIQTLGGSESGHLHMLKSGTLTVITDENHKIVLDKPSIIYIPGTTEHRIIANESDNAQLVCASIKFDSNNHKDLINTLPQFIYFKIEDNDNISKTATWIFDEAFEEESGRQAMLDKLSDIFLLQILRHVSKEGVLTQGILSALSHPQLSVVINAIHESPEKQWNLEMLAELAAMSRSKFAALFRETVGYTPNDYITNIRVSLAQDLLKQNKPINIVANAVGYEHGSGLARVFRKKTGFSPKEWLQKLTSK